MSSLLSHVLASSDTRGQYRQLFDNNSRQKVVPFYHADTIFVGYETTQICVWKLLVKLGFEDALSSPISNVLLPPSVNVLLSVFFFSLSLYVFLFLFCCCVLRVTVYFVVFFCSFIYVSVFSLPVFLCFDFFMLLCFTYEPFIPSFSFSSSILCVYFFSFYVFVFVTLCFTFSPQKSFVSVHTL